jgi:drug/metabolite transporter (DMT)-like permease
LIAVKALTDLRIIPYTQKITQQKIENYRKYCTKESSFNNNKLLFFAIYNLNHPPLKTGFYSVFYAIITNLAIGLCFIPLLLLSWKKMRAVNTYCVLGVYWFLNGLVNLLSLNFIRFAGERTIFRHLNFYYNLAETPLVLLAFACAQSGRLRRQLLLILLGFIAGEAILIGGKGYTPSSSALIIGLGLLLILAFSCIGLWQYLTRMEHTRFENSMVFVYASLLFAYGSFLIIYIFAHVHSSSSGENSDADSFLLYYISLLLSAAITSAGLWSYGIRKSPRNAYPRATGYSSSSS